MIKIKEKHFLHKKARYRSYTKDKQDSITQWNITPDKVQSSKNNCGCSYGNAPDDLPVDFPPNTCKENPWKVTPPAD
ncbi:MULTISPECIES: hypothetical protein [unclassified Bacillus (in: firmicutes)]|uniref:hypothetical protein n=1 Tax=unclassified Bacillus (in: firmicutes) TaxID=185979 RepID=UPI000B84FEC0|nr:MULTISPECIES: hypothetical protein [unclassified Bacillus (in: firmicutes)]